VAAAVLTSLLAFLAFPCLHKRPFRFQATLDPLNAVDLHLLHDLELLENQADVLDTLAGLREKTWCRCIKLHRDYVSADEGPSAKRQMRVTGTYGGSRCLAHLQERAGSAARRFFLVGLRHCLAR
jgi:hypothetical protein